MPHIPSDVARPVYGRPAHFDAPRRGNLFLSSVPELPSAPPAVTWTTPNGHLLTRRPRGIYWEDYLDGACYVVVAIDSLGDRRGLERRVPVCASAADADAAEDELLALLDRCDPATRQRAG